MINFLKIIAIGALIAGDNGFACESSPLAENALDVQSEVRYLNSTTIECNLKIYDGSAVESNAAQTFFDIAIESTSSLTNNATLDYYQISNYGKIDNQGSISSLFSSGYISNSGLIDSSGALSGQVINFGNISNKGTSSFGSLANSGAISNTGKILLSSQYGYAGSGNFQNSGTFNNSGTINSYYGIWLKNTGVIRNSANLLLGDAQVENSGVITNSGLAYIYQAAGDGNNAILKNAGLIDGGGILKVGVNPSGADWRFDATLVNIGKIQASLIEVYGNLINSGEIEANVVIKGHATSSENIAGDITIESGSLAYKLTNKPVVFSGLVNNISGILAFDASELPDARIGQKIQLFYAERAPYNLGNLEVQGLHSDLGYVGYILGNEGNSFYIEVTSIPEPDTSGYAAIGVIVLMLSRRFTSTDLCN